jgi:hemolysin activation/secretion protein
MRLRAFVIILVTAALLAGALPARAAGPPVPGGADAGRVGGMVAPLQAPSTVFAPTPPAPPPGQAAPAGARDVTFALSRIVIGGMTVYKPRDVEPLYRALLGRTVSLADIYALAAKLTAKYRNDGYILSQVVVPPQRVSDSTVQLLAVEGYVDRARFQGASQSQQAQLRPYVDMIVAVKPLTEAALERYMLLMNDMPGVQARAVLSASNGTTGAANLTVVVTNKPVELSAQVDNRGTRYLGPTEASAGAKINNAFGFGESVTVQTVATPDVTNTRPELKFGAVTWSQPVGHEGTRVNIGGSVSDTHPGFSLAQFHVHGTADAGDVEITHPLVRSRSLDVTVGVRFDALDSTTINDLGLGATQDRLRVLRANVNLRDADTHDGVNAAKIEVSKGLDVLNASHKGDADLTRAAGDPQFFKVTAEVSRTQRVTDVVEAFVKAEGQATPDVLLASEQLGLGGAQYNTAYDPSEVTGDKGFAARAELRANNPFKTPAELVQFYGFYDIGKEWDLSNPIASDRVITLADAGAGVRVTLTNKISASLEIAKPLDRNVQTLGSRDPRVFVAVTAHY